MSTITREPVTHNLKIWPEYFAAVRDGLKRAELRWNDREYQAGDILDLCEWEPSEEAFTGDFISVTVTHVADLGQWMPGYVLLSVAPPAPVSVPDELLSAMEEVLRISDRDHEAWHKAKAGILSCRAAMLQGADGKPELTVWYGAMPETNGKTNWTAMLHRKGHHPWEGITIDRSEYPGRVRYEADRMRHLIGELADEPDILAYDSDAHSGYVEPVTTAYKFRDAVEIIRNSGIEIDAEKIFAERDALNAPDCWCRACRPITLTDMRFVVCPDCGNKRCPHANDHRNGCTGSNEPGQEGSAYPAAPQQEAKNV